MIDRGHEARAFKADPAGTLWLDHALRLELSAVESFWVKVDHVRGRRRVSRRQVLSARREPKNGRVMR